jgi:hypothetical protein
MKQRILTTIILLNVLALSATPAFAGRKAVERTDMYWSAGSAKVDAGTFHRDSYACLKENPVGTYMGHRYSSPENDRADEAAKAKAVHAAEQMVDLCLRARGYVLRAPDGTIIP